MGFVGAIKISLTEGPLYCNLSILDGLLDSSVVMTGPRDGPPRNQGSIPGRAIECFFSIASRDRPYLVGDDDSFPDG
jgi:hypothetical protein